MKNILFKQSKIHGQGIFAVRNFKRGEVVITLSSHPVLSREQIAKLPKKEKQNISFIKSKYIHMPPEGRMNHSCDPNVFLKDFKYFAKRNIKQGEEITTDYRKESEPGFSMTCKCGSRKCKRVITV